MHGTICRLFVCTLSMNAFAVYTVCCICMSLFCMHVHAICLYTSRLSLLCLLAACLCACPLSTRMPARCLFVYAYLALRDWRPCSTACPGCWAGRWEHINWQMVYGEEKNIFYWADHSSQGGIKVFCTGTTSPTNQPRKDPFHLYSLSPHYSPKFHQSAGAIHLRSLRQSPILV